MKNNNIKNEYDYQKNMQNQDKMNNSTCKSAILSMIFALFGICLAIQALSLFLDGHAGRANYMWQFSLIFVIFFLAFPTAILAIITGIIGGIKNPSKWMPIVGLIIGILSIIIDIITFVLFCAI